MRSRSKSSLERTFETLWKQLKGPPLEREYRFHSIRRWRFDFADIDTKTAIELEGGTWSKGRHTRGVSYSKDCEKYNAAQFLGWSIYRFTTDMLQKDPAKHLTPLIHRLNVLHRLIISTRYLSP